MDLGVDGKLKTNAEAEKVGICREEKMKQTNKEAGEISAGQGFYL